MEVIEVMEVMEVIAASDRMTGESVLPDLVPSLAHPVISIISIISLIPKRLHHLHHFHHLHHAEGHGLGPGHRP